MSGIDWSKAPSWADCVIRSNDCGDELYWAEPLGTSNGKRCRLGYEDKKVESWHIADTTIKGHAWILIESRPAKACSSDWLPSVGAVCEFTSNEGYNWRETEVLFRDDTVILLRGYELFKIVDPDIAFRPIRTPEQIAEDERNGFITELAGELSGHSDHIRTIDLDMAKYLWSKGYRKQADK